MDKPRFYESKGRLIPGHVLEHEATDFFQQKHPGAMEDFWVSKAMTAWWFFSPPLLNKIYAFVSWDDELPGISMMFQSTNL